MRAAMRSHRRLTLRWHALLALPCTPRSYNHDNIGTSISSGVWATQAHNERKLADAFESGNEARTRLR